MIIINQCWWKWPGCDLFTHTHTHTHTHSTSCHSWMLQMSPKTGMFQESVSNILDKLESHYRIKWCSIHETKTNSSAKFWDVPKLTPHKIVDKNTVPGHILLIPTYLRLKRHLVENWKCILSHSPVGHIAQHTKRRAFFTVPNTLLVN
jgi:hypothetical protein